QKYHEANNQERIQIHGVTLRQRVIGQDHERLAGKCSSGSALEEISAIFSEQTYCSQESAGEKPGRGPRHRQIRFAARYGIEFRVRIVVPIRLQERRPVLEWWKTKTEIVRRIVGGTPQREHPVLLCELAMDRIHVVIKIHSREIAEPRVAQPKMNNETNAQWSQERGKQTEFLFANEKKG